MSSFAELKAMQREFDEARALCAQARSIYERLGLRLGLAGLMQVSGTIELLAGDAEAAEEILRESHTLLVGITGLHGYHGLLLARALYAEGRYDEARALVDESVSLSRSHEIESQVSWRLVKAPLLARAGDTREADKILDKAVALASETDSLNLRGRAQAALAEVLQLAGKSEEAAEASQAAIELFERKGNVAAAEQVAVTAG
jgi:tetratricopeptide (TPR) repeat protein